MEYYISDQEKHKRLDLFVIGKRSELSRSFIKKLIEGGQIKVNDVQVKPGYLLKANDHVLVEIPPPQAAKIQAEKIPLDIVYEDKDLIVVNKPRHMVTHPAAGNYSGTLVNALLYHCKDLSPIGGVERPGVVHRLDKDTSGLLVVAKNDLAHRALSKQIQERRVKRLYVALVNGNLPLDEGTIEAPIGRHPVNRKKMTVIRQSNLKSREARTHYQVLRRYKGFTLLEVKLDTGRTHQIRVHLNNLGYPLVGDMTYGKKKENIGLNGQFLHAKELGFYHPRSGKFMEFNSDLPPELKDVLDNLEDDIGSKKAEKGRG